MDPVDQVVGIEAVAAVTAGEGADAAVAQLERGALAGGDEPLCAAMVELVKGDLAVAGQAAGEGCGVAVGR